MEHKVKEPVRLRSKLLRNGDRSLYLDIYVDGVRKYEFLKLYLVAGDGRAQRDANKQTLALANSVKAARIVEIQQGRFGMERCRGNEILFFDYFESIRDKKTGTTYQAWEQTLKHLRVYEPNGFLRMDGVTKDWVLGFREYLDCRACAWDVDVRKRNCGKVGLSEGTKALYFNKLVACMNAAVRDGVIVRNPVSGVERFKEPESRREYLTMDELRCLACTECDDDEVRRAFLFSCLTGLRWSDIVKLQWDEIECVGDGARIVFRQKKTGGLEYLDVSPQASRLLGVRGKGLLFPLLVRKTTMQGVLRVWVARAGIRKHITFHCARHTFAVMMLDLGTDIYTLSKLLGHRDLSSTQVYARILDKNKQAAVARIPDILG